jgi:hypothetical protein
MIRFPSFRFVALVSCGIGVFFLAGCFGPPNVKVSGTVILPPDITIDKGDPEKRQDGDMLQVTFAAEGDPPRPYSGRVNLSDMTFTIAKGKGIPAGKYKVSISCTPYVFNAERRKMLQAQFKSFLADKTVEVTSAPEQTFTLDLKKNTIEPK